MIILNQCLKFENFFKNYQLTLELLKIQENWSECVVKIDKIVKKIVPNTYKNV